MSIDIKQEKLLSLAEASKVVPMVDGRRPHVSTIFRWTKIGIRGVRLEHLFVGRKLCTTEAALERFFKATAEAPALPREAQTSGPVKPRTISQREAAMEQARKRLAANGVKIA